MLHNPLDGRDTNGIAEAEQRLVQRDFNHVAVWHALQSGTLACGQQADLIPSSTRLEQYLSPASSAGGTKTARNPIRPQFGHAVAVADPPECGREGDRLAAYHPLSVDPVSVAHLPEEIRCPLVVPPMGVIVGQVFDNVCKLRSWQRQ